MENVSYSGLEKLLQNIQADISSVKRTVEDHTQRFDAIDSRLEIIETEQHVSNTRFDVIEARLSSLDQRVFRFEKAMEQRFEAFEKAAEKRFENFMKEVRGFFKR